MVWNKFSEQRRSAHTCKSAEYTYQGDWHDIPLAVRDALANSNFPAEILKQCQLCWASGDILPQNICQFLRDCFDAWGTQDNFDSNVVKGDISEISFLTLRQLINAGKPVVHRPKREALSSRTAGWDLIEIFFETDPWFILWEVKGTDDHPESQSRAAAKQVINRCGPWLAKLSKLLEVELATQFEPSHAKFAGRLHDFYFKQAKEFHIGIAVVVDEKKIPSHDFEMFNPADLEFSPSRQWGILIGIPNFLLVRNEVVKWMLVP